MDRKITTDRELYALKPNENRYERAISKARGLSVLVHPNGQKTFVLRYKAPSGERRRMPIGEYPHMSLADARLKAGVLRFEITGGGDPAGERVKAQEMAELGETVADLAEGYWKAAAIGLHGGRRQALRAHTIARQKGLWQHYLRHHWGHRAFREVRRADVREYMHGLVRAGTLSASSIASIGDVLRALFAYALSNDWVEANPTVGLTRPITPQARERFFSEDALSGIMTSLVEASGASEEQGRDDPHARLTPNLALCIRFLVLTLARRGEAAGARWAEIDEAARIWTIPGERTKNRKVHLIPLSPQALEVLRKARRLTNGAPDGFVFPAPTDPFTHVDPHAISRAVARICQRRGLPHGSPHDFRRTGATTLTGEKLGFRRFIVGKVLGHTAHEGAAVTAVYDRNDYLADKRAALEAWGSHLGGLAPKAPEPAQWSRPPNPRLTRVARPPAPRRLVGRPSAQVIDLFAPRR